VSNHCDGGWLSIFEIDAILRTLMKFGQFVGVASCDLVDGVRWMVGCDRRTTEYPERSKALYAILTCLQSQVDCCCTTTRSM
jgi:hypothetical protein